MKTILSISFALCALSNGLAAARDRRPDDAAAFDRLKSLAGTWKGDATIGTDKFPTVIKYRVVSGGHTVEETIVPDQPHAMVTMYYLDGKSLVLTHYCHMGNQPHMKLAGESPADGLQFAFDGGANINPGDPHMHSLNLKLVGPDHIQARWFEMADGKAAAHIDMDLRRVADPSK